MYKYLSLGFMVLNIYPNWYLLKHPLSIGFHLYNIHWLKHYFRFCVSWLKLYFSSSGPQHMTAVWCFSLWPITDQGVYQVYYPVSYIVISTLLLLCHSKSVLKWKPVKTLQLKPLLRTFLLVLPFLGVLFGGHDTGPSYTWVTPNIKAYLN